jgi:hypothetical protein
MTSLHRALVLCLPLNAGCSADNIYIVLTFRCAKSWAAPPFASIATAALASDRWGMMFDLAASLTQSLRGSARKMDKMGSST